LAGEGKRILLFQDIKKGLVLQPRVKKTYLTLLGLTAVFTCKIKGLVVEKNRFREAVKIRAVLLKWANEHALLREWN